MHGAVNKGRAKKNHELISNSKHEKEKKDKKRKKTWACRKPHKKRRNERRPGTLNDLHLRQGNAYALLNCLALAMTHAYPTVEKESGKEGMGKK